MYNPLSKIDSDSLGLDASLIEAAKKVKSEVFQPTLYDLPAAPSASTQGTMSVTDDVKLKKPKKEAMDAVMSMKPGYDKSVK
jgi:hypothetical protein